MASEEKQVKDPEIQLAEMINEVFKVKIKPAELRSFVINYWRFVSLMTHAIHEDGLREKAEKKARADLLKRIELVQP